MRPQQVGKTSTVTGVAAGGGGGSDDERRQAKALVGSEAFDKVVRARALVTPPADGKQMAVQQGQRDPRPGGCVDEALVQLDTFTARATL